MVRRIGDRFREKKEAREARREMYRDRDPVPVGPAKTLEQVGGLDWQRFEKHRRPEEDGMDWSLVKQLN